MGRKVHPIGFRLGIIKDWSAKWHASDKGFAECLTEDLKLRKAIAKKYVDAAISQVDIERQSNKVTVSVRTARPGIVIGRGGQRVDEMRHFLEELIGKKVQLNIVEISQAELDAFLVARSVAEQIECRVAYRRAMKQAIFRSMQAGAKGIKVCASGRLGGVEIAWREVMHEGRVPLHTLRADIDYGCTRAHTALGDIGIKVWVYRGDILPEAKEQSEPEVTEMAAVMADAPAAAVAEAKVADTVAKPKRVTKKAEAEASAEEKPKRAAKKAENITKEEE